MKIPLVVAVIVIVGLAVLVSGVYWRSLQQGTMREKSIVETTNSRDSAVTEENIDDGSFSVQLNLVRSIGDSNVYSVSGPEFSLIFSTPKRFSFQAGSEDWQDPTRANFQYDDKSNDVTFVVGIGVLPRFKTGGPSEIFEYDFSEKALYDGIGRSHLSSTGSLSDGSLYYHLWTGEGGSYSEHYVVVNETWNLAILVMLRLFDDTDLINFTQEEIDRQSEIFLESKKNFSQELLSIVESVSFIR